MTSLSSDLKHKQPEHDAIATDINRWLDAGNVIERLGNSPLTENNYRYNNRKESK